MTNPIERLRNMEDDSNRNNIFSGGIPLKVLYDSFENKSSFLKEFIKHMTKPHNPSLNLDIKQGFTCLQAGVNIYEEVLQKSLMSYPEERLKMPFSVKYLCNNEHGFRNKGGHLSIGLNFKANDSEWEDDNEFEIGFLNNEIANRNLISFSSLKSRSVYESYIFSEVTGRDVLEVYSTLYYILDDVRHVRTYTIVYIVNETTLREVTLHRFGKYGNILTSFDLKLE